MQTRREADDWVRGTFQGMSEDSLRPFIDTGPFMALTTRHPVVVGQRMLKKKKKQYWKCWWYFFFLTQNDTKPGARDDFVINGILDVFKNICANYANYLFWVVRGVHLLMGALQEVIVVALPSAV